MQPQQQSQPNPPKPYKGMGMEGSIARWYDRNRGAASPERTELITTITTLLPNGGRVLEVAPGPGHLSIAIARLSDSYQVTGLDVSHTFVDIARQHAEEAKVNNVQFMLGNASAMTELQSESFDVVVCVAAFKNFSQPVEALKEMFRVLRWGGTAIIVDLRRDAPMADIQRHIDTDQSMSRSWLNRWITSLTFRWMLLPRAYTKTEVAAMVAQTGFGNADIDETGIGMTITMTKRPSDAAGSTGERKTEVVA